ncbi:MAG: class II aldolase/adducin family protein [Candidatus Delongbacteria bacterium]|nr:class II aldolase/adducin family protein [Candidatus Delongbacteria bacterium]
MSSELEKALQEIKEVAGVIYAHGWGEAYAGNMSVIIDDKIPYNKTDKYELTDMFENLIGKTIVITSSGSRMRQISSKNTEDFCSIITIDETGTGYFKSNNLDKNPSSELLAHLMLHNEYQKRRKNIKGVLHCHPDDIIILLHLTAFKTKEAVNKMLFSIHTEAQTVIPDGAGLIGIKKPGSSELAAAVLNELKKREITLLEKHGCISVGKDLNDALDKTEFVNKAVKIYLDIKRLR